MGQRTLYGAQHLLGLTGIWIFPGIIGSVVGLSTAEVGYMVQKLLLLGFSVVMLAFDIRPPITCVGALTTMIQQDIAISNAAIGFLSGLQSDDSFFRARCDRK